MISLELGTKPFKLTFVAVLILLSSGCATNEVKPWERGYLAKSYMALEPDALNSVIIEQVVTSKESTSGGQGVVGGGCGCN